MTKYKETPGTHGTSPTPDRGMKHGTKIQEIRMANAETGNRFGHRSGRQGNIEDSINVNANAALKGEGKGKRKDDAR